MRRTISVVAALVAIAFASSACDANINPSAAQVGGSSVSVSNLNASLSDAAGNSGYVCLTGGKAIVGAGGSGTYNASFTANILSVLIESSVFGAEIKHLGLNVTQVATSLGDQDAANALSAPSGSACTTPGGAVLLEFGPTFRTALESLYTDEAVLAAHLSGYRLTPAGVASFASANPIAASLVNLSVIAVPTSGTAAVVESDLAKGKSFASLASTFSTTSSGSAGGVLGVLSPTQLPPSIASVVESLPTNSVSKPVSYQGQYLIFKVTERSTATEAEEASILVQPKLSEAATQLVGAVSKAHVVVSSQYGHWAKTSAGYEVVAPSGPGNKFLFNSGAVSPPTVSTTTTTTPGG